ncbi:MAG: hypothetical protein ACYTHJ_01775 [Planctomycetota bacterium]
MIELRNDDDLHRHAPARMGVTMMALLLVGAGLVLVLVAGYSWSGIYHVHVESPGVRSG